jgi:multiple sugar transport system permease protein
LLTNCRTIWRKSKADFILNLVIILFCLGSLFPLYWLLSGSLKFSSDIMIIPPHWIPHRITVSNFQNIFLCNPAWRWVFNSFFTAIAATLGIIFVSSTMGYAFSKIDFFGKKLLFGFVIATLVLPKEVYLLPLYQLMIDFNWRGTLRSLIFPNIAMPFGVFLLKQFYDSIPNEISEAAKIDGCGDLRFFIWFGLPLTKPGIGALGILAFISVWNGYLWQYVMATNPMTYTLPVGIAHLMDNPDVVNYGVKFAGAAVAAIPLLTIFLIFQKYFTTGITAGSIKG